MTSFEESLTQADHQIQGMSIADPKQVRFTDRERKRLTFTPKRPEIHGPQGPRLSPKSQEGKMCNWVGNTTWPTMKAGKKPLVGSNRVPQNMGPKNHKTERRISL